MLVIVALVATGCASTEELSGAEYDPLESLNRGIYVGNDVFDRALLKPIAKGYGKVVPGFMRRGVTNFSANLRTPRSAINNFLQGKPKRGLSDVTRFLFNSTIGVAGLFDIASAGGLEIYDEDSPTRTPPGESRTSSRRERTAAPGEQPNEFHWSGKGKGKQR